MASDKSFLTYNQQMKKLRTDKGIVCNGTPHKTSLVRSGYFNMINGYKMPFTCLCNLTDICILTIKYFFQLLSITHSDLLFSYVE